MKTTINDIAKIAGVSKATVSRVLNESKPVSDEIRMRVEKAIKENNYKPSSIARSLVNKTTNIIGVIIPDIGNPFFSQLVKGIQDGANENGYHIMLCNTYKNEEKEIEYLEILQNHQVDGIVFLTTTIQNSHKLFFQKNKIPVVSVSRRFKELSISSIDVDNYSAAYDATSYLINLDHKEIAMIRGDIDNNSVDFDRFEGYKQAIIDSNIDFHEELVVKGDFSVEGGYNAMGKLLTHKQLPTAIFCASDHMAFGAIKCAHESGLIVPDDISVIGFDDIPLASMFIPSLSTVKQPIYELGQKAIQTIISEIQSKSKAQNIVLSTEIVIRQSTKRKK
ncbi:LacI family DNA-binding transcriptional regulator [Clostridium sp. DL1XJH146]